MLLRLFIFERSFDRERRNPGNRYDCSTRKHQRKSCFAVLSVQSLAGFLISLLDFLSDSAIDNPQFAIRLIRISDFHLSLIHSLSTRFLMYPAGEDV